MIKYSNLMYISEEEYAEFSYCLCLSQKTYSKGDIIMQFSSNLDEIGIMDSGIAHLIRIDFDGQKSILDYYESGNVFGKELLSELNINLYYVQAKEDCTVTFLDYQKLLTRCDKNCDKHIRFLNKIMYETVKKSQVKIDILSRRTIRAKLMTYFQYQSLQKSSSRFTIPLSLSDLAAYLAVDRSAMMREIKKMNDEKFIISKGNTIKLLKNEYSF